MSHGFKLTCFFVISVALHGAALWAAVGRLEPHEPEPSAGVAIVDRELFFRHAARSETQASQPVSVTERVAPVPGEAVRPSQAEASASRAPAREASGPEPERRTRVTDAAGAVARLDPSMIESWRPPRRDAARLQAAGDTEPPEPARLAGVAGAPLDAVRPPGQEAATVARAGPAPATDRVAGASASRLPSATETAQISPVRPPDRLASADALQLPSAADAARAEPTRASDGLASADASQLPSAVDAARAEPARASDRLASADASQLPSVADAARAEPARASGRVAGADASQLPSAADATRAEPARASGRVAGADASQLPSAADAARAEPARSSDRLASADALQLPSAADAARAESVRVPEKQASAAAAALPPAADAPQAERTRASEAVSRSRPAPRASLVIGRSLQPAADVAQAARTQARAPARPPEPQYVPRPGEAAQQLQTSSAEPLARSPADAAARGSVESATNRRAEASIAPARGEAARAAAETARLESASPRAPATDTATVAQTAPADTAPRQPPRTLASTDAAPAPREPPALRGTLPAPLVTPRQTQGAEPLGAPELARAPGEGLRLSPSLPDEPATARASTGASTGADAVASQAAPPAERLAARPTRPAPVERPPAPSTRAAEATPRQLAAVAPATPERLAAGRGDPVDRFTSAYQGGECFFPVRVASEEGLAVRGYGLQAESVDMFRQAFAQALGTDPDVDWRPLTDAQCGGISFTRVVLGGSAPSLHIGLANKRLDWGQELAGRVAGSRADFVTLLIVDDSGVVHNVLDYLRPDDGELAFSVPVHPVDDGADRVQLIMAVGASQPLALLESTTPMHSDDYFAELLHQADEAGATLELGLEDFVILDGSS